MANIAGPMIAQEKIELGERVWNVCVAAAINNVNTLTGMRVVKQQEMIVAIRRKCPLRGNLARLRPRAD